MKILILEDCGIYNCKHRKEFENDEVTYFESVEALLESDFDVNSVELIITDNYMDRIEGLEWLIGVHQLNHKHIPAILFSSSSEKVKWSGSLTNVFGCLKDFKVLKEIIMFIFSEEVHRGGKNLAANFCKKHLSYFCLRCSKDRPVDKESGRGALEIISEGEV